MTAEKSLGSLLKKIRFEKGMSLREFSEYLGISHAYLNKLEKGVDPRTGKAITPTIETLTKIADGLNIPTKKFLDMCGYFDNGTPVESTQRNRIDIRDFLQEVARTLLSAEKVVYNGRPLNDAELETILNSMQIGMELALKKSGKL